ncbi:MAG: PIN domain-containing protein [Oscillospiraceae bacterium]|nr:PIN domain-containing protein [Oscillospiraceae bacterium]
MATYLVDFENVGSDGLAGIELLDENDSVIIFYSANSNKISMKIHKDICASKANYEYFEISSGGKNALDFQLSTYLGYLISLSSDSTNEYCIVSRDTGYQYVIKFWDDKIKEIPLNAVLSCRSTVGKPQTPDYGEIYSLLDETYSDQIKDDIAQIFLNCDNKQDFYRKLVAAVGQKEGSAIYNTLKKLLK